MRLATILAPVFAGPIAAVAFPAALSAGDVSDSCTLNGITLHGKVRIVESYADLEVRVVSSYPDLKVRAVSSYPNSCGEWRFVESYPDFTIELVSSYGDLKIQFVDSYPGLP